ncbi:otoferlin [Bicyclus anynana]|uniref:Otoferlin n=1 Tax=Bicyclus anynana TaxID=110368 RepID=A0ABM3M4V2_BICAN|nr:otoferlin [Bicyclus anynana]
MYSRIITVSDYSEHQIYPTLKANVYMKLFYKPHTQRRHSSQEEMQPRWRYFQSTPLSHMRASAPPQELSSTPTNTEDQPGDVHEQAQSTRRRSHSEPRTTTQTSSRRSSVKFVRDCIDRARNRVPDEEQGLLDPAEVSEEPVASTVSAEQASVETRNRTPTSCVMPARRPVKFVRNFFDRGRTRVPDEEQGLLDPEVSGEPVASTVTTEQEVVETRNHTPTSYVKPARSNGEAGPTALKPCDLQVCITIVEARQLAGLNVDPLVSVQVGAKRKCTSVKESTNNPYYNEYFVFDFHVAPIVLYDQIITLAVYQSRSILRPDLMVGSFKLDVATVWKQPRHVFYHKWAVLTDPDDPHAGPKGYLKCDIAIIAKGENIKVPPRSEKEDDDIEANLLLPDGIGAERQRTRFILSIYRADGLPKMNYTILANMKKVITGENQDVVDPFVEVSFAGISGCTSTKKNCNNPVWNEEIVFTEMFPPLCQRVKVQLRDNRPVQPVTIGTHFIDMKTISHDGDRAGFLPTFGPSYIYFYGSSRDYSLLDQASALNNGLGEGVQYRGRLLMAIRTEVVDTPELPLSAVLTGPAAPCDVPPDSTAEMLLFGAIFDVNMIDRSVAEKPIQFELSIGNAGNSLNGTRESLRKPRDLADLESVNCDAGYWRSTTPAAKATSGERDHDHFLCYWEQKPCMHVRSVWPDLRRRLYNVNMINKIIDKFDEGLWRIQNVAESAEGPDNMSTAALRSLLETVSDACAAYAARSADAPPLGSTRLDRERLRLCIAEFGHASSVTHNLKGQITKRSMKEKLHTAFACLERLKRIREEAQHSLPDVFIWMISNEKRVAYQRINAGDLIYSERSDEAGALGGRVQTLFLKWPERKTERKSWTIPAKLSIYLWLGTIQDKKHFTDELPPGYAADSHQIRDAWNPHTSPPMQLFYNEKHNFQLRAYIYQARSLIGSDTSGLSDPFARIVLGECAGTTQVIYETLSPTWDELIVFQNVLLFSTVDYIKAHPPAIVVEVYDQDKVGKSEFIGRTVILKPVVKSTEDISSNRRFQQISLEWYPLTRGDTEAGELLALFELLEMPNGQDASSLPPLPPPKEVCGKAPVNVKKDVVYPVPVGIRPTLSKYRLVVIYWGLRDLKRIHLLSVDKPRVDIECAGNTMSSTVIQSVRSNPNFPCPVKFIDVELPDQDLFRPPMAIRAVESRTFGRMTLVGTHTINSIQKYVHAVDAHDRFKNDLTSERVKQALSRNQEQNCNVNSGAVPKSSFGLHYNNNKENRRESSPLLTQEGRAVALYGSEVNRHLRNSILLKNRKRTKKSINVVDHESSKDWWTKYFASVESMIDEEKKSKKEREGDQEDRMTLGFTEVRAARPCPSPRPGRVIAANVVTEPVKCTDIPKASQAKIYPHELEAVPEFEEFKDQFQSFELYRGKKTNDEQDDGNRIVGVFKGAIQVYPMAADGSVRDEATYADYLSRVPSNEPTQVLVRVYVVKATDLHPMDLNGKADPYIVLNLGSSKINDKDNYVSKQLNPVFGKCFEIEATFPQNSMLTVQVKDWDLLGSDDLIGETKIDLENRFYSRHRATCGLSRKYEEQGYNRWRDSMKPSQILAKLCKDNRLSPPTYGCRSITVGDHCFEINIEDEELFGDLQTVEEQMALEVLHRWQELPAGGCALVPEHVETRSLYNPRKPGVEQGKLQMWVDMFPKDATGPGRRVDISARKPKSFELRVVICNTEDVILEDDEFFTGEKMSDIYVKGWLKGPDDCQCTDIHYRSLTGEGNFNWRFIFPFNYLEAEERIVTSRKESVFSWDETECKIPARLELQVWDADHFTSDDFLGAIALPLTRFPRGAKTAKLCTLKMLSGDGSVPMVNLFKQKRIKGWWPFYTRKDSDEIELTGKLEAEIHLLTKEEAEKSPAGLGRGEPDALDKPNRPDASFMWLINPLKSIRYILCHNSKWCMFKYAVITFVAMFLLVFLYHAPGYIVRKILGD